MRYDNVKYLIFDENGKFFEDNEFVLGDEFSFSYKKIQFNLNTVTIQNIGEIVGTCDIFYAENIKIRTKSGSILGNDYFFIDFTAFKKQYGAMIYHDGLHSHAPELFREWIKFFLPASRPKCGCSGHYDHNLSYVNKVHESIKTMFPEYGKYNEHTSIGCGGDMHSRPPRPANESNDLNSRERNNELL